MNLPISSNLYPWQQACEASGGIWPRDRRAWLDRVVLAGLTAIEPAVADADEATTVASEASAAGLTLPSAYLQPALHEGDAGLAIAIAATRTLAVHGVRRIVVNPLPLSWMESLDKNDAQLERQAAALISLAAVAKDLGLDTCLHVHDAEFRSGAREFQHLIAATAGAGIGLCLDADWWWRGLGCSQAALFAVLRRLALRVRSLHLRQTRDGRWTPSLGPGELDYVALRDLLDQHGSGVPPQLVLETAIRPDSGSVDVVAEHVASLAWARTTFAAWLPRPPIPATLRASGPVTVAICGCGFIARQHAEAARALLGAEVRVLAADPAPSARAAFAEALPWVAVSASPEAMLSTAPTGTAIAVVATPPASHVDLATTALSGGWHLLLEKPVAVDGVGRSALAAAAVTAPDRVIHTCSNRLLGYPVQRAVRRALAAGDIGRPYQILCRHRQARARSGIEYQPGSRWFLDRRLAGGGCLMDWGVYDLAMVCSTLSVQAATVRSAWVSQPQIATRLPPDQVFDVETDAGAAIELETPWGAVALDYLRGSGTHAQPEARLELVGDRGSLQWDWLPWEHDGQLALRQRRDRDGLAEQDECTHAIDEPSNAHHRPLAALFAQLGLLTSSPAEPVDLHRALAIESMLTAIVAVANDGQPRRVTVAWGRAFAI